MCCKNEYSSISIAFDFLIINVNILSNFEEKWCTFNKEKGCLRKKDYPL
jgi:hypothetical protein